jgi:MFS family permease
VPAQPASLLATRRGKLLLLLCAVQFLDVVDSSIMNVALPSIRRDLGFSAQGLQWVLSGYLVTYGGLLLLGGRAADLLGRRRLLVAGTVVFAACSLVGGLATGAGMLVGARLGQGAGAAMMAPAGLSILTTSFNSGDDRSRALGVWGAISGLAAAAGAVRQPAGLRADPRRRLPAGARRAARRPARWFRHPRRGAGHHRHAAAGLRPGPGAGAGLGERPHDR